MTGTGTQADPYIVSTWDEFLTTIAQDGVYVECAEAYTWNLDEIYADSVIPSEISIGYGTIVDGKDSVVKSSEVDFWVCDFSGDKSTILNLRFLLNTVADMSHYDIYLLDDVNILRNLPYVKSHYPRYKFKPNLTLNLTDDTGNIIINLPFEHILQSNNLTIKNSRDLHFVWFDNISNHVSHKNKYPKIYNLNITDCYCRNSEFYMFDSAIVSYYGDVVVEFYDCTHKIIIEQGRNLKSKFYVNHYQCNVSYIGLGTGAIINATYYKDCNIYGKNMTFNFDIDDCYVSGTSCESTMYCNRIVNSILEIENIKTASTGSNSDLRSSVFNSDLSPELSAFTGSTALTTEEIRNPQKLFDAGIPINPTGG